MSLLQNAKRDLSQAVARVVFTLSVLLYYVERCSRAIHEG